MTLLLSGRVEGFLLSKGSLFVNMWQTCICLALVGKGSPIPYNIHFYFNEIAFVS